MRILLAVDGSASADRALDLVAALPWHDGGRVRIVSVAPSQAEILGVPWSLTATSGALEAEEAALTVHRNALEAAEHELRSVRCDIVIEPVLLRGRTASLIVEEAREMPADLIVIGHRGHSRHCSGRCRQRSWTMPHAPSSSHATTGSGRSCWPTTGRRTLGRRRPS
jgi:nucleotide-binding universal stress UspA family protein